MNSILPALLGLTLMLSRGQALICQSGTYETVRETSEPPLEWTVGAEFCMDGWGCQDSLMLVENGPQVLLILTKGCTPKEDHEARVTQHRKGPGLSVVSYTRVCRHQNFCNDLTTSLPVWSLPTSAVPGSVRCPVCFGEEDCESAVEVTCPFGHNHCYNGTLQIRGDGIFTDLKVQGCMSQRACNLLNETREIGALSVNEKCDSVARLICDMGIMLQMKEDLAQNPLPWDTFLNVTCDLNEVCQETLLLIDVGPKSLMVGSKGCSKTETQNSTTISIHLAPPGVLVASYAHFCSSNGCNRATSSSVLLNSLPRPAVPAPGDLQCPACVHFRGSCSNSVNVTCPRGTTHCYNNDLNLQGGGVSAVFSIQGCVAQPSSSLLKHTKNIGQFIVSENGAVSVHCLAWVVGLGLSLTFWCGIISPLTPFTHDFSPLLTP
ncbi:unnamed protein product [Pipistrellus nathusii]|uniref:UPAR/Ly6 domain-containing protein n=1 Tax=Pipistrellus nathusii TaxID=59473 RepID=A0ABN9ZFP5_PIPNA